MTICYSMKKTCKICNSLISDNNNTGIGCECRYSYDKARRIVFFDEKSRGLSYFAIEVKGWLDLYVTTFKDTKFRSKFKKSFYPSIVEQYKTKGYVSKKQLEICKDMLYSKADDCRLEDTYNSVLDKKKLLIENYKFNEIETDKIINLANKFRYEFR